MDKLRFYWPFFDNINFWTTLFCKNGPNFRQLGIPSIKKHQQFLLNLLTFKQILPKFVYPLLLLHNQSHANVPILPYVFFVWIFWKLGHLARGMTFFMKCFRLPTYLLTKICSFYYHLIFILAPLMYYILWFW